MQKRNGFVIALALAALILSAVPAAAAPADDGAARWTGSLSAVVPAFVLDAFDWMARVWGASRYTIDPNGNRATAATPTVEHDLGTVFGQSRYTIDPNGNRATAAAPTVEHDLGTVFGQSRYTIDPNGSSATSWSGLEPRSRYTIDPNGAV
jgi:hypothetical protein